MASARGHGWRGMIAHNLFSSSHSPRTQDELEWHYGLEDIVYFRLLATRRLAAEEAKRRAEQVCHWSCGF